MQTCFFSARHGFAMLTISYHACLLCVMIGYFGFTFVLRYTYIHVYCYTILISSETITFDGIQVFGACQMVVATSNYLGHHADSFFVDGGVYSNGTYSLFVFQCSTAIRHICKYKYVYMCICMRAYICICVHMCVYVCICVYMCLSQPLIIWRLRGPEVHTNDIMDHTFHAQKYELLRTKL